MVDTKRINIDFDGQATGFVGSTDSGFGVPASNISVSGGGQIQTITQWNEEGYEVPVYAYVVAGIPQATLTAERGVPDLEFEPTGCWAKFVNIGGGVTTVQVTGVTPDPTQAKSVGSGGASFTWIVENAEADNPYSTVTSE